MKVMSLQMTHPYARTCRVYARGEAGGDSDEPHQAAAMAMR